MRVFHTPDVPKDEAGLRAFIEATAAGGPDEEYRMFIVVGDLLRQAVYRADLYDSSTSAARSTLFEVASTLPGVELLGTTPRQRGRSGVAVGYTSNGTRHDLIFNPETSALIAERDVAVDSGEVTNWTVFLASQPVPELGETPR